MKRFPLPILLVLLLSLWAPAHCQDKPTFCPTLAVYFSPNGGCTQAIIRELDKAKSSVLIQAYSFTSVPIAKALLNTHKRGVKVQVILDKSQRTEKYCSAGFMANRGIPIRIDAAHAIAHNKVMGIDGETLITGSFNFTSSAEERNAENLLVIIRIKPWVKSIFQNGRFIGSTRRFIRGGQPEDSLPRFLLASGDTH